MNNMGISDKYSKFYPALGCTGANCSQAQQQYSMGTTGQMQQINTPQNNMQITMPQNGTQMNSSNQLIHPGTQYFNPDDLLLKGIQEYQTQTPAQPKWSEILPTIPSSQSVPLTPESLQYLNGFLRTQVGKRVTVEFLIGTSTLVDRTGLLLGVGINYIIINETDSDDIVICDFYNIKFVKVYY